MADDCVPASPLSYRANKRKSNVLRRRSKRFRGNATAGISTESSAKEVIARAELSTILEEAASEDKPGGADFTALYWPEPESEAEELQDVDIFAEVRLLEQANQIPLSQLRPVVGPSSTQGFTALCEIPNRLETRLDPVVALQGHEPVETQLGVSETQLSHLCQVADAVADLQRNISKSQWNSPLAKATVSSSTPQSSRPFPGFIADDSCIDIDYFSESDDDSPTKPNSPPRKERRLDEAAAESYSRRKFNMQLEKASRKRINFYDDSDSKSCLSSELSLQSDDGNVATPIDNVDLNKSSRVCANLQNLSSFFSSQSFVQDDIDGTIDGVFRYIMLMKSKRKEARMLDWFRSGRNFRLDDTGSSRSFHGFREEEEEPTDDDSICLETGRRNEMNSFLDDDDHLFRQVEVEECSRKMIDLDVESVLQSADRILHEATETVRTGDLNRKNFDESLINHTDKDSRCEINIDALLKGDIIASLLDSSTSSSTTEHSPSKWNLNHKSCNSLTASVIESAEEMNSEKLWKNVPKSFNDGFIVPKSADKHDLSNMPSCSKSNAITHVDRNNQLLNELKSDSANVVRQVECTRINQEKDYIDLLDLAADWIADTQFPSKINASEVATALRNVSKSDVGSELKVIEALSNPGEFLKDLRPSEKNSDPKMVERKELLEPGRGLNPVSVKLVPIAEAARFGKYSGIFNPIDSGFVLGAGSDTKLLWNNGGSVDRKKHDSSFLDIQPGLSNGFQFASGKAITVSKSAQQKAKKLLTEVDFNEDFETELDKMFLNLIVEYDLNDGKVSKENADETICVDDSNGETGNKAVNSIAIPKFVNEFGFQLPSGKAVSTSESPRSKAAKLIAEFEKEFDQQSGSSIGFQSAFTKGRSIPEAIQFQVDAFIPNPPDKFQSEESNPQPKLGSSFGFQLASGKTISISESARSRAEKFLSEFENGIDQPVSSNFEFQTDCGAKISELKAEAFPSKLDCNRPQEYQINSGFQSVSASSLRTEDLTLKAREFEFKLASGKAMSISDSARLRAAKLMAEFDQQLEPSFRFGSAIFEPEIFARKNSTNLQFGENSAEKLQTDDRFAVENDVSKTAPKTETEFEKDSDVQSGSSVRDGSSRLKFRTGSIKAETEKSQITFQSDPKSMPKSEIIVGFQLASGKATAISETGRLRAAKLMAEFEKESEQLPEPDFGFKLAGKKAGESMTEFDANNHKQTTANQSTAAKCNYAPIKENLKESKTEGDNTIPKRILRSISDQKLNQLPEYSAVTPNRSVSMSPIVKTLTSQTLTQTPERSQLAPSRSSLSLSKKFKPPEKFITPIKSIPQISQLTTPNLREFFDSVETSTPKNCLKSRAPHSFSLSQEISASTAALLEDETDNCAETTVGLKQINWDGFDESLKENVPDHVRKERELKRCKQIELIQSKRSFRGIVAGGVLFTRKNQTNRKKLCDLKRNISLRNPTVAIDFANALHYKFVGPNNVVSIRTEEDGELIPDTSNRIGAEEIANSFLSLEAVSPRLIPAKWIEHHYKMIVLKLFWLETFSSGLFLSPQNVLLQLKYRYDHEIDRAHRSSLKRILAGDDCASKRIVLVIVAIYRNQFDTELELSDRWYSIRTSIDLAMQKRIRSGKIAIGTKLMIQSAELSGCESGCSPLEITDNVRLKIHTNSTRRAKWDTKLGFYRDPIPFRIRFDRIDQNGGVVTKLAFCVLRVYPSTFMTGSKRDGEVCGFHSEKIESLLRKQEDVMKFTNIETIFSEVQNELDAEDRKESKSSFFNRKSLKDITDPAELYELVRCEWDFSEIETELTAQQLKLLNDYQQQMQNQRLEEVQKRVKDRLQSQTAERRSIELYKLRVIEPRNPQNSAVLSIWRPHTDIKSMLQEKTTFQASHIIPNGIRCGELQLTSSKKSQYCILQNTKLINDLEQLFRRTTRIREICSNNFKPTFNELDTCGLIVMIGTTQPKRFQPVYVADSDGSLLCLNFWSGIKEYGYDDIVQVKRFIAISNLQWRSNSAHDVIPTVFVTDLTVFTENPKHQAMINSLKEIRSNFHDVNVEEFVVICSEKILEHKERPKSNVSGNASLINRSLNSSSPGMISVQTRIDRLRMYGNPTDVCRISTGKLSRSVRKGFKLPSIVGSEES